MVEKRENQRKIFLSWRQFGNALDVLLEKIKKSKMMFTGVYGLPRGGLPMAVYMSHRLNIPLLQTPKEGCLVVDDILDSGQSMNNLKNMYNLNNITIAVIHYKEKSIIKPDYYVVKSEEEHWIVYPWEE